MLIIRICKKQGFNPLLFSFRCMLQSIVNYLGVTSFIDSSQKQECLFVYKNNNNDYNKSQLHIEQQKQK